MNLFIINRAAQEAALHLSFNCVAWLLIFNKKGIGSTPSTFGGYTPTPGGGMTPSMAGMTPEKL